MRKFLFLLLLFNAGGCKKEDPDPTPPTPSCTAGLASYFQNCLDPSDTTNAYQILSGKWILRSINHTQVGPGGGPQEPTCYPDSSMFIEFLPNRMMYINVVRHPSKMIPLELIYGDTLVTGLHNAIKILDTTAYHGNDFLYKEDLYICPAILEIQTFTFGTFNYYHFIKE